MAASLFSHTARAKLVSDITSNLLLWILRNDVKVQTEGYTALSVLIFALWPRSTSRGPEIVASMRAYD
jgi:hypothetical protein